MNAKLWVSIALISLLVSACGGPADPTSVAVSPDAGIEGGATSDAQTNAASDPTAAAFVIVTRPAIDEDPELLATLPSADEISVASATEDPDIDLVFDEIELVVYGGGELAERITLVVRQDGSFDRNGTLGFISPQRVQAIDTLLDELNFYGLNANFIGLAASSNRKYQLTVTRNGRTRSIQSEDGYMPVEYRILLAEILNAGVVP